jgi:hypothetical protein
MTNTLTQVPLGLPIIAMAMVCYSTASSTVILKAARVTGESR